VITAEELPPFYAADVAGLRDIPLGEMAAVGMDVLGKVIGRVLPDPVATPLPVAAFQSSI
jgi:FXSXX-COOH protein